MSSKPSPDTSNSTISTNETNDWPDFARSEAPVDSDSTPLARPSHSVSHRGWPARMLLQSMSWGRWPATMIVHDRVGLHNDLRLYLPEGAELCEAFKRAEEELGPSASPQEKLMSSSSLSLKAPQEGDPYKLSLAFQDVVGFFLQLETGFGDKEEWRSHGREETHMLNTELRLSVAVMENGSPELLQRGSGWPETLEANLGIKTLSQRIDQCPSLSEPCRSSLLGAHLNPGMPMISLKDSTHLLRDNSTMPDPDSPGESDKPLDLGPYFPTTNQIKGVTGDEADVWTFTFGRSAFSGIVKSLHPQAYVTLKCSVSPFPETTEEHPST